MTEEQTLKIAQPNVIEQIRLRVLCEQKGEYSVALNHLLNEIQAICFVLDEEAKDASKYKEPAVMEFLKNQKVPSEGYCYKPNTAVEPNNHAYPRNPFNRDSGLIL